MTTTAEAPAQAAARTTKGWRTWPVWLYLAALVTSSVAVTIMARLWRATWSVPFNYVGDATSSAMYFKTVLDTGWYESQPDLGVPYGQHLHDFPFSDDLQPMMIKIFGIFTHQWPVVFNAYYVAGFPLAALSALYFLRRCGLSSWLAVSLSVLYSVAPYHFWRRESHFFLGEYWAVPLGLVVVLTVLRGEPVWGRRVLTGRCRWWPALRSVVAGMTGRGAATFLSISLVTLSGAYYGVFTAVLLAPAAVLALVRTRNWRRFLGAVTSGVVLVAVFIGAMLPDTLYERAHGADAAAFARLPAQAEIYALKFLSLILPAAGHPIPALARLRLAYDTDYKLPGEEPALGLIGSIGFLLLLGMLFLVLIRGRNGVAEPETRRRETFRHLSALTWIAFLAGTVGGLGTFVSFLTPGIRGWNRISILIALLALAGFGSALETGLDAWHRRRSLPGRRGVDPARVDPARVHPARVDPARVHPARVMPAGVVRAVAAILVLVIGVADQSSSRAVPDYADPSYGQDDAFVKALETRLPDGAEIFQLPYLAFPEGGILNKGTDTDQLKLWLHSTTLRWSGGGIKGRPQTTWPKIVSQETPRQMTTDLAVVGFAGIVIDRNLTRDRGAALAAKLSTVLGPPQLTSDGGRWSYFSLAGPLAQVAREMSPAQRSARAARVVRAQG